MTNSSDSGDTFAHCITAHVYNMQVISEVSALIDSYLRQERTIILAIVPANQDVATVDIL
jgi:hypothetical protein